MFTTARHQNILHAKYMHVAHAKSIVAANALFDPPGLSNVVKKKESVNTNDR
jgi:hypothetical protein